MSTESEDDQSDRPGASYQASYQTAISSACHALVEKEKCSCETEKVLNSIFNLVEWAKVFAVS